MKIGLDNVHLSSSTGPNSFGRRLAMAFMKEGHRVNIGCGDADVVLTFIQQASAYRQGVKVVQRLDGIWFSPEEFQTKNVGIKSLYGSADHVVWQSAFDRTMVEKWWGPRLGDVIPNGIATDECSEEQVSHVWDAWGAKINEDETVFVCAANWHPQKRLNDNIAMFLHLRATQFPNSCLFVLGSNPDVHVDHPRIFYVGSRPEKACLRLYRRADWFIHLAWLDHCPNVVVEALAMGCQVIASDSGGTHELLNREHDVIIPEKVPYSFELTRYDEPPPVDVWRVPRRLPLPPPQRKRRSLDIVDVAKLYVKAFERIL